MKSPRLGDVAAKPSSLPVRRVNACTVGVGQQDALEHAHLAVGLGQRGAGRRPVVEDEAALVHLGQEAGPDHPGEAQAERQQRRRTRRERDAAVREHPADRPAVALLQRARARAAGAGAAPAPRRPRSRAPPTAPPPPGSASSPARARAAPRPPARCANERKNSPTTPVSSPSGAKTTTVVRVEPATGPRISSVPVRTTSAGGSSGCSASRRSMFSTTTTASSMMMPIATASPPRLIRLSESPASARPRSVMATVSGRLSAAARRGAPLAQEEEQHQHRERAAEQHRVAHAPHRVAHQRGLVVHRLEPHAGRQQRADRVHRRPHRGLEAQRVAVRLAGDVDQRGGPAVAGHDLEEVLARRSPRCPGRPRGPARAPALPHHDPAHRLRRVGEPRDDDGVLPVVAVRRGPPPPPGPSPPIAWATWSTLTPLADEPGRIELHADLAHPPAFDLDLAHVRQPGQPRPHGELGEIAEHQRIGAGELVLQHREHRRREPLGAEVEPVGQRAARGGEPALHLAQRELHVGVGPEVEAQLAPSRGR